MAFTKVVGAGIHTLSNIHSHNINSSGIITATQFIGPITGGGGNFNAGIVTATSLDVNGGGDISGDLTVGGSLTVNGDFTTLNTTLREVELLRVDASTSSIAGIITQSGSGHALYVDGTTILGNSQYVPTFNAATQLAIANLSGNSNSVDMTILGGRLGKSIIKFGDHDSNNRGSIQYHHTDESLRFYNNGNAINPRLIIDASGDVGINSTSPREKLDIIGNANVIVSNNKGIKLGYRGESKTAYIGIDANDNANAGSQSWGNSAYIGFYSDGSSERSITYRTSAGHHIFQGVNGTEFARITSAGNLGIGTETPGAKLSIMGGSVGSGAINALELKHYTANNGGDGIALLFNGGYQNNAWAFAKISAVNSGSGFGADLQVHVHPADGAQSSSVVKALSIVGNGSNGGIIRMENSKVGIGTNIPKATYLHVGEAYNAGNVFTSSPLSVFASGNLGGTAGNSHKIAIFGGKTGGNTSGLSIYHYRRANGTDWTTDGFSLRQEVDNTSGIYDFMNFTAGNVGVNNVNPTAKLHVSGAYNQTAAKVGAGGTGYTNALEVYNANGSLQFAVNTNDIKLGLGHRALYYQRNLAAAINSTTEIVRFQRTHGAHSMRVSIVCSSSGFSVAKVYEITTSYNQTSGGWRVVRPISSTGRYDSNFELLIKVTNTQTDLKLRKIDFATYAGNCDISINYTGSYSQAVTVTNQTATGTDTTAYDVFEEGFGLYDVNNGQTALTLPTYHPAFLVHPANDTETADGFVTYTSVSYNQGSHYKTSGGNAGKFIAPVFGRYFFAANYVGAAACENVFVRFYINGSVTNKGNHYSGGGTAWTAGSPYMSADLSGTCVQLGKDDYVQLHLTGTNGGGQGQAGYMRYFGYLVG